MRGKSYWLLTERGVANIIGANFGSITANQENMGNNEQNLFLG
jgi:hypothetical protein